MLYYRTIDNNSEYYINSKKLEHPKKYIYNTYLKTCNNPQKYNDTIHLFQLEFEHMIQLQDQLGDEVYSRFFPYYDYFTPSNEFGQPCLSMQRLEGETLEEKLCRMTKYNEPHKLLTSTHIRCIYEQLYEAIAILYDIGMIPLDLSPQNIFVLNNPKNEFKIKLIDFTECYYINYPNQNYKTIDTRVDTNNPIGIQLRDTCALLFTRLFFSGNEHYNNHFSLFLHRNNARICENFFSNNYPSLLNCLFSTVEYAENICKDDLTCWKIWYNALMNCVKEYPY